MQRRDQVLGCTFNWPPRELVEAYAQRFRGLDGYPDGWSPLLCREGDLMASLDMITMAHLGFDIPVSVQQRLNEGFDVAVDYFVGEWWKDDETSKQRMDKTSDEFEPCWFNAFSTGLLLGLLSQRWDDVARICDWVDAELNTEYLGDDIEEQLVHLYKSIAAGLRDKPMRGIEQLEAKIKKSRKLRPKLLFQAWDAARNKNQAAFDETFIKSLEHFASTEGTGVIATDWVAPHHSVVGLAARRYGMKWPELPPKLEAVLLSPESLGIA